MFEAIKDHDNIQDFRIVASGDSCADVDVHKCCHVDPVPKVVDDLDDLNLIRDLD